MTQTIEQLTARVRELEEEIERLSKLAYIGEHQFDDCTWKHRHGELRTQLAASQLHAEQLRSALQTFIAEHEECEDGDGWVAQMCSMEALHAADEALSAPFTPTAFLEHQALERLGGNGRRYIPRNPLSGLADVEQQDGSRIIERSAQGLPTPARHFPISL